MEEVNRLFVYGTLQPGAPNHHKLEHLAGSWVSASVRGLLIAKGWGADHGCPGLRLSDDGEPVPGHLLTSEGLAEEWPALDEFEGDEYERVLTEVSVSSGQPVKAYVYVIR
ncbi:MAG: gamma-glutamylcyclotransferase family protein [Pseudomonadota bacterium]